MPDPSGKVRRLRLRRPSQIEDAHAYLDELIDKGYGQVVVMAVGGPAADRVYHYEILGEDGHSQDRVMLARMLEHDELDSILYDDED